MIDGYHSLGDGPVYMLGGYEERRRIIVELARAAMRDGAYSDEPARRGEGCLFDRIATAIGRTRPFVRHYFRSKAELLRAVQASAP